MRTVFAWQRRCACRLGVKRGHPGSVTSIQRFSSTLSTNVHFHSLFPDGVFTEQPDGTVRFVEIDPPTDAEVEAITRKIAIRVLRLFQSLDETGDSAASSEPLLESLLPPEKSPHAGEAIEIKKSPRCALLGGFSIHANVSIGADKKDAVERLCRYIMRPPVALSRLAQLSNGTISYRVKNLAPHQPAVLRFEPLVFMRKLAQLIPPPRVHIVRYFGVWAPNAKLRSKVVPLVAARPVTCAGSQRCVCSSGRAGSRPPPPRSEGNP